MKSIIAVSALIGMASAFAPPAHANYAWRFNPTNVSAENPSGNGYTWIPDSSISSSRAASWLPSFDLSITDAAFASHALSVAWSACDPTFGLGCGIPLHGDVSAIAGFTGVEAPSPSVFGSGSIDLAWDAAGRLAGNIFLAGMLTDLTMASLDDGQWQGRFLSDNSECGMTTQSCFMTGNWQFLGDPQVPEPAALAVLGIGILGLAYARRGSRLTHREASS